MDAGVGGGSCSMGGMPVSSVIRSNGAFVVDDPVRS